MTAKHYVAPDWRYIYGDKPKGRRMRLLSVAEAKLANDFIRRHIRHSSSSIHPDRYQVNFCQYPDTAEKFWLSAARLLRTIARTPESAVLFETMDELNELMNCIFSDQGWRWVRKELSQSKKRVNKTRIELSSDLAAKLKNIMAREQFISIDETIDHLLSLDTALQIDAVIDFEE